MKKAVTVFVVLTPIAFLIWALAFALSGILDGDIAHFLPYLKDMFFNVKILWQEPNLKSKIFLASYACIGLLAIAIILYLILPPVRKRFGYMWHIILAMVSTIPPVVTLVNFSKTFKPMLSSIELGTKVLGWFVVGSALLTGGLMFILFLLSFIDWCKNPGGKRKVKVSKVDDFGVDVNVTPALTIGENGLSSKAIPASEPVPVKKENTMVDEIRSVVQEELQKMHSRLQVRQNVTNSLSKIASDNIAECKVPDPTILGKRDGSNEPVKIVIMTDSQKAETPIKPLPSVVPMVQTAVDPDSEIEMLVEPMVEAEPEIVEEPLIEPEAQEEPPYKEPKVEGQPEEVVEDPLVEQVAMEEPPVEEEPSETYEVVEESNIEEPEPEILPEPEFEDEPEDEDKQPEEVEMVNEVEVTPEEDIKEEVVEKPAPVVEEKPLTFEKEPEGLVKAPEFEEEPEPEQEEKVIVPVIVPPVVEEVKPTYERISFMDRMINAEQDMKDHYNILKNLIMSYGVKSRVSNSGDAFRLHTKTYVKITIAGKSLKLYFALDPKDYENTTLPIQDASNKGIYEEIPLVFKVKSDLSMKRAKDLIADAMAKDGLEQGEVEEINYVELLKEEVASEDEE